MSIDDERRLCRVSTAVQNDRPVIGCGARQFASVEQDIQLRRGPDDLVRTRCKLSGPPFRGLHRARKVQPGEYATSATSIAREIMGSVTGRISIESQPAYPASRKAPAMWG